MNSSIALGRPVDSSCRRLAAPLALALLVACGDERAAEPTDPLAAGWTARVDLDKEFEPGRLRWVDGDLEVEPGDNVTLWHPRHRPAGSFRLAATVTHLESGLHPHGAGLAFGGTDIESGEQSYGYFLVRGDGRFLIKTRSASNTTDVVPWTEHAAVAPEDEQFVARNALAVEVDGDEARFVVNGVVVHRAEAKALPTAGRCGFRLVHDLRVRFGPLELGHPTK